MLSCRGFLYGKIGWFGGASHPPRTSGAQVCSVPWVLVPAARLRVPVLPQRGRTFLAARGASKRANNRQAVTSFTQGFLTACLDELRFDSAGVLDFATAGVLLCQKRTLSWRFRR